MLFIQTIFLLSLSSIGNSFVGISKNEKPSSFAIDLATKVVQHSRILFVGKRNGFFSSLIRNTTETHLLFGNLQNLSISFDYNILHFYEVEQFKETVSNLQTDGARGKYICITENKTYVQELIDTLWRFKLYKSVVILENDENLTFFRADYKNCGKQVGVNELRTRKDLLEVFELKMEMFFRSCELRVAYSTVVPWVYPHDGEMMGILVALLKVSTEKDQFKLRFLPNVYDQYITNSYNFSTLYRDFENGKIDIFVGVVSKIRNFHYVDISYPLIDDSMIFVIPKGRKMPYWKAMMQIYSPKSWALTLFLFLIFLILLCLIGHFSRNLSFRYPIQNFLFVYGVFLSMSVPKRLNSKMIKFLFLIMFLICMINSIVIQGKLFSIFSVSVYERDINDIGSLLKSGLPIKLTEGGSLLFYDGKAESKEMLRVYKKTNQTLNEVAEDLAKSKNFASIMDKVQLMVTPSLKESVTILKLVHFEIVYLFKKHLHLFERLHFQVERCIESGFMDYILRMFKWRSLLAHKHIDESQEAFKLTVDHLQGHFYILLVGLFLSTATFLAEMIFYHIMKCFALL